jgi:hypothetical protein
MTRLMQQEDMTELSEENIFKIKEKYRDQFDKLDAEFAQAEQDRRKGIASFTLDVFGAMTSEIFQIRAQKLDAELSKVQANHQKELESLQQQRDKKLISDADYQRRKDDIDEKYRKKEREIKRKQARAEKLAGIFSVAIETAKNITEAFPNPFLMAAAGVLGALQIGLIAAKPVPQYKTGNRFGDKVLTGPSHSSRHKGLHIIDPATGQLVALAEGGETLLSRQTRQNNPEIVDALLKSSLYHGGRSISRPTVNAAALTRYVRTTTLARGGIMPLDSTSTERHSRNPSTGKEIRWQNPADDDTRTLLRAVLKRLDQPSLAVIEYDYYTQRMRLIEEQQKNGQPGKE